MLMGCLLEPRALTCRANVLGEKSLSDTVKSSQVFTRPAREVFVSVIIPAYNAAATIRETLTSLIAQTWPHWEAIVVDDGSTDITADIARGFAAYDARFRVVTQPNGGESAARNAGIALARFDWLLFLDADDWISPFYLEHMINQLAGDPSLDAVHCRYARVAADGTFVPDAYQPPTGDMFATLARRAAFPVHACIVRKSLVDVVGGFDTSLRTSPDWDLWQRVARTGAQFGGVPEVLAFYRMSANGASLDGCQLFKDGLRVLKQGHSSDARVANPHPSHILGEPPEQLHSQEFYLLSWCAGLMLGAGKDPDEILSVVREEKHPGLYADAVAQCIFEAVPLPACQPPSAWEKLWPGLQDRIEEFLVALERRAGASNLTREVMQSLRTRILKSSPIFSPIIDDLIGSLEEDIKNWRRTAVDREQALGNRDMQIKDLEAQTARLERDRSSLLDQLQQCTIEREKLQRSYERQIGDLILNRLRMRAPLQVAEHLWIRGRSRCSAARMRFDAGLLVRAKNRHRVIATVCDKFPIYSQTFVYQELTQLAENGFDIRLIYSNLDSREYLPSQFSRLWDVKRCLLLDRKVHERDFGHYHARMTEKVNALIDKLCAASGLNRQTLLSHDNFLQAFSFTRMVEAYRPHYLHSYFFYDRSLMSLVAGYLLDIPRGITCYADHLLNDYELKVVPLHLELCDIILATSNRIRQELLEIAPSTDPGRIIVKPNGIHTAYFPVLHRSEPAERAPFRLVSVCRMDPKKGLLELVEATHLLRQRGVRVETHIVGAVDEWSDASRRYKREVDRRISELGLWGTVHLEGRQNSDGVRRFLEMAQLFVAPFVETESGDKDGIPTAMLEGMATGLPVVATDAGSIMEVIENGEEGIIVPQRDPEALAASILYLLRDRAHRLRLGEKAERKVRAKFDVGVCETVFHERLANLLASEQWRKGESDFRKKVSGRVPN